MSVLITLWLLGRKRETLACRLAGLSFWQLSLPFVLATLAFKMVELAIINPIGANCLAFYERLESRAWSGLAESFSVSENGIWIKHMYDNHHAILRIAAIEHHRLRTITLFEFNQNFDLVRQVEAEYGDFHDGELVLSGAQALSLQGSRSQQDIRIASPLTLKTLMNSGRSPTSLSVWELPRFITILEKSGLSSARHRLHWYRLYAHSVLTLAMVLLALGCAFFRGRAHKPLHMSVMAIFVGLALFFIDDVTWALGVSGRLPLWFAAWSPALVALMLGVILLLNLEDA
jgi:lipopolysaccharide export system permease protein